MSTGATTYSLTLRDVPPGPGFERLPIPAGEGLHTGGPWFDPALPDLIWKPLDARPFVNADVLVPTREAEILGLLAGRPGFPRNWTSAVINGRGWIIRRRAEVLGPDTPPTRAEALEIEQALRALNAAGWCLNDHVTVARDAETGQVFVLDLSAAAPQPVAHFRDDWRAWCRWVRAVGHGNLAELREAAYNVADAMSLLRHPERRGFPHVYASASTSLPDLLMAALLVGCSMLGDALDISAPAGVIAWILTADALDATTCERLGLMWGWSPIEPE